MVELAPTRTPHDCTRTLSTRTGATVWRACRCQLGLLVAIHTLQYLETDSLCCITCRTRGVASEQTLSNESHSTLSTRTGAIVRRACRCKLDPLVYICTDLYSKMKSTCKITYLTRDQGSEAHYMSIMVSQLLWYLKCKFCPVFPL